MLKPKQQRTFAEQLRSLREAAGLTVVALAQRAGIGRTYLHDLEAGRRAPSLETAQKLATALGRGLECWNQQGE